MRLRTISVVLAVLIAAGSAVAQQTRVSLSATDLELVSSSSHGSHLSGGGELAVNHFWTPEFSTMLAAGAARSYDTWTLYDRDSNVVTHGEYSYTAYPFDLLAQFHFATGESRWKPYVGAGVRYTDAPSAVVERGFSPVINGGVMFNVNPRVGVVFDVRAMYYRNGNITDFSGKPALGVSWRF